MHLSTSLQASTPRRRGFTLIEIMIAVAIVAILAALALPSFLDSVRKSKRSDAFAAIAAIQQSQERWRANNPTFSTSLTDLRVAAPGLYGISITAPPDPATLSTGYTITATGQNAQAADSQCKVLSLRLVGGNLTYAGCGGGDCSYATTNVCWSR